MTRERYKAQLAQLRADVCAMAETTLTRYRTALEALETGDPDAARQVIEGDTDINELYLALEGDCIELFALQQPVAGDLRFVASSFKILTDLERVGDLATNLARYGSESGGGLRMVDIQSSSRAAGEMVADAIDAYADDDSAEARSVAARDDGLDMLCRAASETVVRELLTKPPADLSRENGHTDAHSIDDPEGAVTDVRRALLAIRDIERVGDHAVNICARTVYMIENNDDLLY